MISKRFDLQWIGTPDHQMRYFEMNRDSRSPDTCFPMNSKVSIADRTQHVQMLRLSMDLFLWITKCNVFQWLRRCLNSWQVSRYPNGLFLEELISVDHQLLCFPRNSQVSQVSTADRTQGLQMLCFYWIEPCRSPNALFSNEWVWTYLLSIETGPGQSHHQAQGRKSGD